MHFSKCLKPKLFDMNMLFRVTFHIKAKILARQLPRYFRRQGSLMYLSTSVLMQVDVALPVPVDVATFKDVVNG